MEVSDMDKTAAAAIAALRAKVSENCRAAEALGLCKFNLAHNNIVQYSDLVRQINRERNCTFDTVLSRNQLIREIPDTEESWYTDRATGSMIYELISVPGRWGPKWLKTILDHKADLDRVVKITEAASFNATHQEICDALYAGLTGDQAALDLYLLERELIRDGTMLGLSILTPTPKWDPAQNMMYMTFDEIREVLGFDPIQSGSSDLLLGVKKDA